MKDWTQELSKDELQHLTEVYNRLKYIDFHLEREMVNIIHIPTLIQVLRKSKLNSKMSNLLMNLLEEKIFLPNQFEYNKRELPHSIIDNIPDDIARQFRPDYKVGEIEVISEPLKYCDKLIGSISNGWTEVDANGNRFSTLTLEMVEEEVIKAREYAGPKMFYRDYLGTLVNPKPIVMGVDEGDKDGDKSVTAMWTACTSFSISRLRGLFDYKGYYDGFGNCVSEKRKPTEEELWEKEAQELEVSFIV